MDSKITSTQMTDQLWHKLNEQIRRGLKGRNMCKFLYWCSRAKSRIGRRALYWNSYDEIKHARISLSVLFVTFLKILRKKKHIQKFDTLRPGSWRRIYIRIFYFFSMIKFTITDQKKPSLLFYTIFILYNLFVLNSMSRPT